MAPPMVSSSMGVVNANGAGFGTLRDEVGDQMPQKIPSKLTPAIDQLIP